MLIARLYAGSAVGSPFPSHYPFLLRGLEPLLHFSMGYLENLA
jgi:hypothetical protein